MDFKKENGYSVGREYAVSYLQSNLIASSFCLAYWNHNRSEIATHEFIERFAITLPVTAVVWLAVLAFSRNFICKFALPNVIIALFYGYSHLRLAVFSSAWFSRLELMTVVAWIALCATFICLARIFPHRLTKLNGSIVLVFSLILLANLFGIVSHAQIHNSDVNISQLGVIQKQTEVIGKNNVEHPNIYYLIFDAYARGDVLRRVFSHDNSEFLESLITNGYSVLDESLANYPRTYLSLASSLNLEYLDKSLSSRGLESTKSGVSSILVDNLFYEILKKNGYEVTMIRSSEWGQALEPRAHTTFSVPRLKFQDDLLRTTIMKPFAEKIPLQYRPFRRKEALHRIDMINSSFNNLRHVINSRGGKSRFTICHFNMPHQPFLFDKNGQPANFDKSLLWGGYEYGEKRYLSDYVGQLQHVNNRIIEIIEQINLEDPDAVVILQSDHGSHYRVDLFSSKRSDLQERFGILNAIKAPERVQQEIYSTMSPVNTFRVIANALFSTNYDLLEDRCYFPVTYDPLTFEEVDVSEKVAVDN